jgi:uncharacterized protein (TIGR02145 family)
MRQKNVMLLIVIYISLRLCGLQAQTVKDIDGNVYKTVKISNQIWMAENLKTTKYNDGIAIPNITDNTAWSALTTPALCWYDNDEINKNKYGALYNWFAVNTNKLCPTGWHVPSDAEWTTLTTYLGGESVAGVKLKESGETHWLSPEVATNESGFTALSGGSREYGTCHHIGDTGYWWSSTENSAASAYARGMFSFSNTVSRDDGYLRSGFSVRCLRD